MVGLTVGGPGDEAAGAVRHVEGAGREGELDGAEDADERRDAALQRELHLRLVRVPRRERHGDHPPRVQVRAQARHAAAGVEDGADGAVGEGDDGGELVDVLVGAAGELGAAAGEAEEAALVSHPVLHRLLHGEALVRRVRERHVVAAPRPRERRHVPRRRRHQAPQPLAVAGAVPLPVHHVLPREPHRALLVVARRVVRHRRRARRELRRRRRHGLVLHAGAAVVRLEAQPHAAAGRRLPVHGHGDAVALAVAAALPRAEQVEEAAEADGDHHGERAPPPVLRRPAAALDRHG
ncbi:Os11g0601650, partial [Oryza sativa Japonica Group]